MCDVEKVGLETLFPRKNSSRSLWFVISYGHKNKGKNFFVFGSWSINLIIRSASRLIVRLQVFKQFLSNMWWCCQFWTSLHAATSRNVLALGFFSSNPKVNNNFSPKEQMAVTWTRVKAVNWVVPRSQIKFLYEEIENSKLKAEWFLP